MFNISTSQLRLRPVFEGGESPGIFFKFHSLYREEEFGIFPSPRAYMEKTVGIVTPRTSFCLMLRQQAVFEREGKTGILLSSRAGIFPSLTGYEKVWNCSWCPCLYGGNN